MKRCYGLPAIHHKSAPGKKKKKKFKKKKKREREKIDEIICETTGNGYLNIYYPIQQKPIAEAYFVFCFFFSSSSFILLL